MKMTWFQHPACTTEEADELVKQYRRRGVKTERSLNHDCINWTVSALLPEVPVEVVNRATSYVATAMIGVRKLRNLPAQAN